MKNTISRFFNMGDKIVEIEDQIQEITEVQADLVINNEEIKRIPVENIIPNRFQPRTVFADDKINELMQTIRIHGIIQPIVLRKYDNEKYEIIAGERRWRAVTKLGWETIPAIIKEFDDTETASVALIENLQREELTPLEEAIAYAKLLELHNLTQEALAQRLGKGQSTVANKLRLLKLPEAVQEALLSKKITERHARALIPLKEAVLQEKLVAEIIEKQYNVKQTEARVVKLLESKVKVAKPKRKAFSKDTRIAMNTIRQSVDMITNSGMKVVTEEQEHEDYIQFTIKIPKGK